MEVENIVNQNQQPPAPMASPTIDELQRTIAERQREIDTLKATAGSMETTMRELNNSLKEAVNEYHNALVLANPEIPPDLITGDTVASVRDSVTRARAIVEKVKQKVEAQISFDKFPTGSPPRGSASDLELTPREKIERGIAAQSH